MLPLPADIPAPPPPPRPIDRAAAFLEIVLCSGFPTQLLLITVVGGLGLPMLADGGGVNPRFLFTVSLLDAVAVIGLIVLLLRAHGESVREVLVGRARLLKEATVGIAMIPLALFVVIVIRLLVLTYAPYLHNVTRNPFEDMLRNRTDIMIFAVVVMVAGGVREEIQRGFIVHRFGRYLGGGLFGVLFYSVLFGLGHYEQGYDAAIATAALGAMWGLVYLRRGSVVAPMVSHAGFNLLQILQHVALR